ncbi:P-type conjugative transfer protein TrbJ [Tepidicella xavieri]|uniref:P-type conjugative transfer protein TrbJ n=1 Tax=Tepidicella xavieri TaxID=360241 RepID=A0A4R6TWD6_9BURK|nr:P-type conjugative transfer protein TrbJ [Tepidicella xavieri]TDQ37771.1 P-type conjugative transfer protein TrbJ [Tepidicella xavieri]
MKKTIIAAIVSASLVAAVPPSFAGSVAGFGGATEITQLANNVELVNLYLQQVQSYATQLQQYQNMIQNTLNIPAQVWGAVEADLMSVANIVKQGQALAYSATNIASQFENTFKGFTFTGTDFKKEYRDLSRKTLDTLKGALMAANMQSDQFANEEMTLKQLRTMSQSATGQMQAIQVGVQIAEQQVQQLQKLRQLMMAQLSQQNTYLAAQEQKEATRKVAADRAFDVGDPTTNTHKGYRGGWR